MFNDDERVKPNCKDKYSNTTNMSYDYEFVALTAEAGMLMTMQRWSVERFIEKAESLKQEISEDYYINVLDPVLFDMLARTEIFIIAARGRLRGIQLEELMAADEEEARREKEKEREEEEKKKEEEEKKKEEEEKKKKEEGNKTQVG